MDVSKQAKFNQRMGKRKHLAHGGKIERQNYTLGGAVAGAGAGAAAGSAILPGIGTVVGAIGGFISGLFGGGPQPPNITDPVTGQQITDANGRVVATQDQLLSFANQLQGTNGVQNQQNVLNQLQAVASGQGPNPAQAELAQATGQNVAQTGALMAGQRGASQDVGLIAREAGQTGAGIQQTSAGQAATLQAQQSLTALNSEGVIAGQQVGETAGALGASNTAASNNQSQILGAEGQFQSTVAGGQANVNTVNATEQQTALTGAQALAAGVGAGKTAQGATNAGAGNGTPSTGGSNTFTDNNLIGPQPLKLVAHGGLIHKAIPGPHKSHVANYLVMAKGGKVPAMVSPGEQYLNPEQVQKVLAGANPLKLGERISGKAKVKGDSLKNDTVAKTLDEGGVVISREHMSSPEKAALFVHRAVHMKRVGK